MQRDEMAFKIKLEEEKKELQGRVLQTDTWFRAEISLRWNTSKNTK